MGGCIVVNLKSSHLNLATPEFLSCPIFSHLDQYDSLFFKGEIKTKIQLYEAVTKDKTFQLMVSTLIQKEDATVWKSLKELLEYNLKLAANQMRGVYHFDLLIVNLHQGIQDFNGNEFSELLLNHSRKLDPGQQRLIHYGPIFGILSKRTQCDWGKISFNSFVEVYHSQIEQFDLYVKKLINLAGGLPQTVKSVIVDISNTPLFQFGHDEQTMRLRGLLEKNRDKRFDIYVIHWDNISELWAQFQLK